MRRLPRRRCRTELQEAGRVGAAEHPRVVAQRQVRHGSYDDHLAAVATASRPVVARPRPMPRTGVRSGPSDGGVEQRPPAAGVDDAERAARRRRAGRRRSAPPGRPRSGRPRPRRRRPVVPSSRDGQVHAEVRRRGVDPTGTAGCAAAARTAAVATVASTCVGRRRPSGRPRRRTSAGSRPPEALRRHSVRGAASCRARDPGPRRLVVPRPAPPGTCARGHGRGHPFIACSISSRMRSTDGIIRSSSESADASGMCGVVMRTIGPSRSQKPSSPAMATSSAPQPEHPGVLLHGEQPPGPAERLQHGRGVERHQRAHVDDLAVDAPLGQLLGGREGSAHHQAERDDRRVLALAAHPGRAELVHDRPVGDLALGRVEALVLEEEHRVVAADGGGHQAHHVLRASTGRPP